MIFRRLSRRSNLFTLIDKLMNKEQINTAIAKAMGMHLYQYTPWGGKTHLAYDNDGETFRAEDYHGDLNACHDALTHLFENVWYAEELTLYGKALEFEHDTAVLNMTEDDNDLYYELACLSNQGAEAVSRAIVKTLGLWKEGE